VVPRHVMVSDCTIHNVNNEQKVAMTKALLANTSLNKKNNQKHHDRDVEQFMYSSYAWESNTGNEIVKEYWRVIKDVVSDLPCASNDEEEIPDWADDNMVKLITFVNEQGQKFVGVKRASNTRWWTLGESATVLWKTLPMRIALAQNFDKLKKPGKAGETCQTFLSLAKDPEIICDLALVKCHHRYYIARHLKFFQQANLFCRKSGFQAFNIFVRVFLMRQDYNDMSSKYGDIEEFVDLKKALSDLRAGSQEHEMAENTIAEFFSIGLEENVKLF
jgi:hypothetical protein